eukprot:364254-Chlamydomonas_euryale.AAC.3
MTPIRCSRTSCAAYQQAATTELPNHPGLTSGGAVHKQRAQGAGRGEVKERGGRADNHSPAKGYRGVSPVFQAQHFKTACNVHVRKCEAARTQHRRRGNPTRRSAPRAPPWSGCPLSARSGWSLARPPSRPCAAASPPAASQTSPGWTRT